MQLFREIEKSGNLFPYFDYAHGYGIPQANHFLKMEVNTSIPSIRIVESGDSITIFVNKDFNEKIPDVTVKHSYKGSTEDYKPGMNKEYFYYNIMNKSGTLDSYYILDVTQSEILNLLKSDFIEGESLNMHFAGYSTSIKF
jgi:hypothetical protein